MIMNTEHTADSIRANALLIAAAPDLLDAAMKARDAIMGYKTTNHLAENSVLNKALKTLLLAIARAHGNYEH